MSTSCIKNLHLLNYELLNKNLWTLIFCKTDRKAEIVYDDCQKL